uniref:ADAM10 endopeptidase n=1 Tax=Parascaris univalens TaxID=6257 RepID=A0A914ZVI1_PARUN
YKPTIYVADCCCEEDVQGVVSLRGCCVGATMRVPLLLISVFNLAEGLIRYVDSYETLNYKPLNTRQKRSAGDWSSPISLQFTSLNRSFNLHLRPLDGSSSVFDEEVYVDEDGSAVDMSPRDFLYQGYDKQDAGSTAYGSVLDGIFDGHIHYSNGDSYTVDKIGRYLGPDRRPSHFHSVIYSDSLINHPTFRRSKRSNEGLDHGCGMDEETRSRMDKFQRSVVLGPSEQVSHVHDDCFPQRYLADAQRYKRDVETTKTINGKQIYSVRACYVYLQADQKLYQHIYEKEGNLDPIRTREEIASLFYNHVKAVNQIYEGTNFNGIYGIKFVIQRISMFTPQSCEDGKSRGTFDNPFCEENVDVSNYLNLNSRRNHSDFCLAYAFTFRDFVGGTLGLAWVASPNHNTAGGICQQYTKYSEGANFVYRSLNTGIITLVNYGNRVPTRVSQLTLAHEIGHNFGSPHDYPAECQPGLPNGNFIMFASATSGDKRNNAQFSKCSIANISLVLTEVLQQRPIGGETSIYRFGGYVGGVGKRNCFRETKSAFCGNQVKEPGEECDCGYTSADCQTMDDICCIPRQAGNGCRRVPNASCSPSEGPCCDAKLCAFHPASANKICRAVSECLEQQYCNGSSAECPESLPKEDGRPCQDSTKVCYAGNCNGSVCAQVGLKDCFLTEGSPEHLCHLACEDANGTCRSSLILPQFAAGRFKQVGRENRPGLILLPGSPCNNYKGYCDIFRKCRSVDADGPLARLKNVIFNPKTLHEVKYWIQVNWWVVVIGGLGLLLFMAVFIKCCAVHTPSTNPNKAPALNIYDTLRRPKTLIQRPRVARSAPENGSANAVAASRRHNAHHPANDRTSSIQASFHPIASAPPMPPTSVIVVEPPPPYTASTDPGAALGGPKRGHRKNKRRSDIEMRVKNRRN